jgi:hypothetical protein
MNFDAIRFLEFVALIRLKPGSALKVAPGGVRFSPTLRFDSLNLSQRKRFGYTVVTPREEISSGGEGEAHLKMAGGEELLPLIEQLKTGSRFSLFQGPNEVGDGVVDHVLGKSAED